MSRPSDVHIANAGLTGLYLAKLLANAGLRVSLETIAPRPAIPLVVGSRVARMLLEPWRDEDAGSLPWRTCGSKRVRWSGDHMTENDQDLLIGDTALLQSALRSRLLADAKIDLVPRGSWSQTGVSRLVVHCSASDADDRKEYETAGKRIILLRRHAAGCAPAHTTMERISSGWLFSFPVSERESALLLMLPAPPGNPMTAFDTALADTAIVNARIGPPTSAITQTDAFPRVRRCLVDEHAIHIGSAAARLDPICGNGFGFALDTAKRTAVAILGAPSVSSLYRELNEVRSFILRGFAEHLQGCAHYYRSADMGAHWSRECMAVMRGAHAFHRCLSIPA